MSKLSEVFYLCHPTCPQNDTAENDCTGCVLGGKFSLATPLSSIDVTQILLVTSISTETVSQTAKGFMAF